jgi:hypothetical protein
MITFPVPKTEEHRRRRSPTRLQFGDKPKTVGLLLRLCSSVFGTGNVIILDSGFGVLQGIAELHKRGVFVSAVI